MHHRVFNHDLLVNEDDADRDLAARTWPTVAHLLVNSALVIPFRRHEAAAIRYKRLVHNVGLLAVVLLLVSLVGSIYELLYTGYHAEDLSPEIDSFRQWLPWASCITSLSSIITALLASRHGPFRRSWLRHRFATECIRRWHFRALLNATATDHATDSKANSVLLQSRARSFSQFINALEKSLDSKMSDFRESGNDPVDLLPLSAGICFSSEIADAYRSLRLDHQLDYFVYKLSEDDRSLWRFSGKSTLATLNLLASMTLFGALGLSVLSVTSQSPGYVIATAVMGALGVAVRTVRDGLAIDKDVARYQEARYRLQIMRARWQANPSMEEQTRIAFDLEQWSAEELRGLLLAHHDAQFLA